MKQAAKRSSHDEPHALIICGPKTEKTVPRSQPTRRLSALAAGRSFVGKTSLTYVSETLLYGQTQRNR